LFSFISTRWLHGGGLINFCLRLKKRRLVVAANKSRIGRRKSFERCPFADGVRSIWQKRKLAAPAAAARRPRNTLAPRRSLSLFSHSTPFDIRLSELCASSIRPRSPRRAGARENAP